MQDTFISPSFQEPEMANFISSLRRSGVTEAPRLIVDGDILELPSPVAKMFKRLLADIVEGRPITVISHETKLTTQQAADYLGMSRPTVIKMINKYSIPIETIGRHRRILFNDVEILRNKIKQERVNKLQELRKEERELGLYDEYDQLINIK